MYFTAPTFIDIVDLTFLLLEEIHIKINIFGRLENMKYIYTYPLSIYIPFVYIYIYIMTGFSLFFNLILFYIGL